MIKKTKRIEEIKEKEEVEKPRAVSKGREDIYFFPNQRKSVKASSMKEALEKLK